jgi:hypothetical protein
MSGGTKNQGGNAPDKSGRRLWSCRIASSRKRTQSCRKLTVSDMLTLCWEQLTMEHFGQLVQAMLAAYDIHWPENTDLKGRVMRHQQRERTSEMTPPTTIKSPHGFASSNSKRKAFEAIGETPSKLQLASK